MVWGGLVLHGALYGASRPNAAALGCIRMQEETTLGAAKAMPVGPGSAEREAGTSGVHARLVEAAPSKWFLSERLASFSQWGRGRLCSHVVCCEVTCSSAKWGVLAVIARVVDENGEYDYEAGRL